MAIEYTLLLEDDIEVLALAAGTLSIAGGAVDQVARDVYARDMGISPCHRIILRLDKGRLREGEDEVVEVTRSILRQVPGDALLLFNGELPILRRTGGTVVLGEGRAIWTDERRLALGVNVKVANLGGPL